MSPITCEDVETIVLNALGPKVQVINYRLQPFSKEKTGGLGTHHSLTIEVKKATNNEKATIESRTFFVKTPSDSPIINDYLMDEYTFLEEVHFYSEIRPLMDEGSEGDQWSPRCYLSKRDAIIVEDLRARGYTVPMDPLLDEQHLRSALSSLARFHASSILAEQRLGKSLKEAYPSAFEEKLYTNLNKLGRSTKMGFETAAMMAKWFGLDASLVPKIYDRVKELVGAKKNGCNVICHGDIWKNNLMFDNSNPPKCILVDYQFLRYASPAVDVSMLLYLHSVREYRTNAEEDMFEHYYFSFRDALLRSGRQLQIPSYEDMLEDYNERRIVGMAFAAVFLTGISLKAEELSKIMNDPMALTMWLLQNRNEVTRLNLEKDPVYEKKMKNIVTELLEEAERTIGY